MKSHWKSIRFFNSVETCAFTVEILFWTIAPVLFEVTFPRVAFVPFSGLMPMKRLELQSSETEWKTIRNDLET